jgi:hypothetical protein
VSDPFEERLRNLMRDGEHTVGEDDERLGRVLHKAHVRGGVLDLLTLFSRWGLVLSEAGTHHTRKGRTAGAADGEAAGRAPRED